MVVVVEEVEVSARLHFIHGRFVKCCSKVANFVASIANSSSRKAHLSLHQIQLYMDVGVISYLLLVGLFNINIIIIIYIYNNMNVFQEGRRNGVLFQSRFFVGDLGV